MSNPDANARLQQATGLSAEVIRYARAQWANSECPMRKILNAEALRLTEIERTALESCGPEELQTIQGNIAGIRKMLAACNAQGQ